MIPAAPAYGFLNRPTSTHLRGELRRLELPLLYRSKGASDRPHLIDRTLVTPAGLVFDGASIPRFTWRVMPSKTDTEEEGAMHDHLFRFGPHLNPAISFDDANWLIWESLELDGTGYAWQRAAMWSAVSTFGLPVWNRWRSANLRPSDPDALATYNPYRPAWKDPA